MSVLKSVSTWALVMAVAALVAMSWVSVALAEADGDGLDGDEILSVPLLIGVGVLGAVAWVAYRRRSTRPQK